MKKFLLVFLSLILVLVIGFIVFIKFFDFNNYKPEIEKLARKYGNIEVKINGDLKVALSLKPTIEINDVNISMPDGQKIAQIGDAFVQFSILPLLKKEFEINFLETTDTNIFYNEKDSVLIRYLAADMDSMDEPINIKAQTTVEGIEIDGTGKISSLKKLKENNFNDIDINADFKAMGYNLNLVGILQGLQDNLSADATYKLEHKNNEINGRIQADLSGEIPYIKLDAESAKINAADFTNTTQKANNGWFVSSAFATEYISGTTIPYEYLNMFNLDANIDIKKLIVDDATTIQNLQAEIIIKNGVFKADIKNAETLGLNINGKVSLDSPKSRPYLNLNIKGNTFDLQKFTSPKSQKQSYIEWIIPSAAASSLMLNTTIPYQYLNYTNADINFTVKKLIVNPQIQLGNISGNASIKNGVFKADIKNILAGDGNISGTIKVDSKNQNAAAKLAGVNIILQSLDKDLAKPDYEIYVKSGGKTTAFVDVTTSGKNTDQYLANLSGKIIAFTDPSIVKIKSLERLQGNIIVQILQALKLNVVNKEMNMKCAVFRSDVQNGKMSFPKGIVFDANDLYLVADGDINLGNEKINLAIQPFSGKITDASISSLLGSLIKIKGTISNPQLAINQTATAKSVIGAIATAGAYNVGDMLLSADSSPCHTALIGTQYSEHFKQSKTVRSKVSNSYNNTQDMVKDIGKNLKDSAKEIGKGLKGLFK